MGWCAQGLRSDPTPARNRPLTCLRAIAGCAPGACITLRRAKARPAAAGEYVVAVHPLPTGEGFHPGFWPGVEGKVAMIFAF